MTTEAKSDPAVPESTYADYEQDLLNDGLPPAQARATRRALERVVDRLLLSLASKTDMRTQQGQLFELQKEVAVLKAEMRLLKWIFALIGSGILGMMAAMLAVMLTRL